MGVTEGVSGWEANGPTPLSRLSQCWSAVPLDSTRCWDRHTPQQTDSCSVAANSAESTSPQGTNQSHLQHLMQTTRYLPASGTHRLLSPTLLAVTQRTTKCNVGVLLNDSSTRPPIRRTFDLIVSCPQRHHVMGFDYSVAIAGIVVGSLPSLLVSLLSYWPHTTTATKRTMAATSVWPLSTSSSS